MPRLRIIAVVASLLVAALSSTAASSTAAALDTAALDDITLGPDFRTPHADILRLYFAIFDRAPDVGGARFWIDQYNEGMTTERIADHMSQSAEFVSLYGDTTVDRFVTTLYRNVLDREPDPGGFEFWTSGIDDGSFGRLWVLRHFADSNEFVTDHRFPGEADAPDGPPLTRPVGTAGPITTFSVEVEPALGWSAADEAEVIVSILADGRSWAGKGTLRFQYVESSADADVRVRIATPATVDTRCRPLRTVGRLSCRSGRSLNLNSDRWAGATSFWTASLAEYRAYLINHEMGHFLSYGHRSCPGAGRLAPVMQQQTKSLQGCRANGWPYPG